MIIGDRLRDLRDQKKLSQGDIEKRSGMLRCYISRVENGHTTPAIETLEKWARALEIPLYQLFNDGDKPPRAPHLPKGILDDSTGWGHSGKDRNVLDRFRHLLSQINDEDRKLLLSMAGKMALRTKRRRKAK